MKPIKMTSHAKEQCIERGAAESEVVEAIRKGRQEPTRKGRKICKYNFSFQGLWQGNSYAVKQVAPVIKETRKEIIVVTVYTYYF